MTARTLWLAAGGAAAGAAAGVLSAVSEIRAHAYLEDGMTTLALLAIRWPLAVGAGVGALLGVVVAAGRVRAAGRGGTRTHGGAWRIAIPLVVLVLVLAAVVAVPVAIGQVRAAAVRERPNVLFVLVDALRADALGSYGARPARTPVIDGLAARGLRFANAYSNAPKTVPSVASLFTGTLPVVHDVWEPPEAEGGKPGEGLAFLADRLLLAPEVFRDAGYRTAMITTTGWITPEVNYDQGVDDYRITDRADEEVIATAEEHLAAVAASGARFFAYVHLLDLHDYYRADRLFGGAERQPEGISEALWRLRSASSSRIYSTLRGKPERFPAADVAFLRAAYGRELARTDAFVGRLVAALERGGVAGETLVVLTADHGEQFGEHGRLVHGGSALYDEVLRIPVIVAGPPRWVAPRVVEQPLASVDLFPTLFGLVGIRPPAVFAGRSFAAGSVRAEPILATDGTTWKMVSGEWSYIFSRRRDREELYHLAGDPGETRDLVRQRAEVARGLRRELGERIRSALRHPYAALEKGARVEMNARVEETLRSLGYLN